MDDEWPLTPMAERRVRRNLEQTVRHSSAFCLVAENDGEIVGFVTASFLQHPVMPGTTAEIEELTVAKAHRGSGFGRELLAEAVRWCRNAGVRRIRAHVEPGATGAIRLMEKVGFEADQVALNIWE